MNKLKEYKEWFTPEAREHYWEELYKDMERKNMKLEAERDKWRKLYEQTLAIAVQATDHE
jgi:hypothetical protein|tara:strand:+ start:413 stop:592 length:180 start_codon:yes stop_codon:yes gene_type:complete